MRNQGMRGVCLVPRAVQTQPTTINCLNLAHAGIKVLVRLNWGWADGTGTVPPPEHEDAWVDAIIATIAASRDKGVWGWIIGNEVNNPVEWPGGYPNPTYMVSPAYYVRLYNRIWRGVQVNDLIAPVPLDPYNVVAQQFGQPADPRDWAQYIYAHIAGADFLALHTKTQGNDPAECWSDATFTDWPLIGRFLHLRTIEDHAAMPARWDGSRGTPSGCAKRAPTCARSRWPGWPSTATSVRVTKPPLASTTSRSSWRPSKGRHSLAGLYIQTDDDRW
jgi:hypothetical protein